MSFPVLHSALIQSAVNIKLWIRQNAVWDIILSPEEPLDSISIDSHLTKSNQILKSLKDIHFQGELQLNVSLSKLFWVQTSSLGMQVILKHSRRVPNSE